MPTIVHALATAGFAGLVPLAMAASDGAPSSAPVSRPALLATAHAATARVSRENAARRTAVRVVLPGPYDRDAWTGEVAGDTSSFVPTPGSPVGPRAARFAEQIEFGRSTSPVRSTAAR